MKNLLIILFLISISMSAFSQNLDFEKRAINDTAALDLAMNNLANRYLDYTKAEGISIGDRERLRYEMIAGRNEDAIQTIRNIRAGNTSEGHLTYSQYELYLKAKIQQNKSGENFQDSYRSVFSQYIKKCTDIMASTITVNFTTYDGVAQFTDDFHAKYAGVPEETLTADEAKSILNAYFLYHVYSLTEPIIFEETERDENDRYLIEESLIISARDSAEISVITVRKRNIAALPAILIFTIYADNSNKNQAMIAASKGYVGVIANSRGKRKSTNAIEPYKHEYKDVYETIDWISKQSWCNGKVAMYGGSYNGFSQWASMKEKVHPALKTIIPSVSAAPGLDVPMENNIFHNFPYKWIPFVTNNKLLDNGANFDAARWNRMQNTWYTNGLAYNKMDSIDGVPNPLFQEWISHPTYDSYWQAFIPYKEEFAHIDIPILTTTGYYDDGQRGAMYYYLEHLKYNPTTEHYLLLGPYDHFGAQTESSANLRGYEIDSVANLKIQTGLAFEWFDYILKGKKKPILLKDKVNFQVMGENKWLHRPTLAEMSNDSLVFYLSSNEKDSSFQLTKKMNKEVEPIQLSIDLADRSTPNNADYYPWPIIKDNINLKDGLVFKTNAFQEEVVINGSFTGEFKVSTNKQDFDYSINLYELLADGSYFHLSYIIGRASHAKSIEERELLTPNKVTTLTFNNTRIISKKIAVGSRLIAVINGNKNPNSQINYGSGKEVSLENLEDADEPIIINFHPESKLRIPLWREP
ncbi:CocE/NonD family hydrolase [uncultured Marivirga sp.]|uniref:CocE/NonD family hydrolase n=1 Tax=uncultured Marivirga sp. TaxID=1123707 RepID=UPI0030EF8B04